MRTTTTAPIIALSLLVHCCAPAPGVDASTDTPTVDLADIVSDAHDAVDSSPSDSSEAGAADASVDSMAHEHAMPDVEHEDASDANADTLDEARIDAGPRWKPGILRAPDGLPTKKGAPLLRGSI